MQAVDRALADGSVTAAQVGLRRPRDDRRDERDHRGQDRARRLRHDRGVPRPARDRPPGAAVPLRHPVREGEAARPARPRGDRRRAARPGRRGAAAARGRLRARGGRDPAARGGRVGRRLPAPRLRQPRARAARRRDPRRGAAGRPDLALRRGRARVPRVPARLDDRDQRRHPPGRRALSGADREPPRRRGRAGEAARDAVERRRLQLRGGAHAARVHGRVRPRRRGDRLGLPRGDARPQGHPLLRHGRHDRQGRPDPGRAAVGDEGLQRRRPRGRRDRRHVALRLSRCGRRSSTSSRSARAAARSPGSTRAACCASARRAQAPIPGRSATGAAARSRP